MNNYQITKAEDSFFDQVRRREYESLDKQGHVYLDYTGANLAPKSLIQKHQIMLMENILGNPHSSNPSSIRSTLLIEETRSKVLQFFNAQDYTCVFTLNATAALKIVGESYPFNRKSMLLLLSDNHNSVNGIREYCTRSNGIVHYAPVQGEDLQINEDVLFQIFDQAPAGGNNLFAYPAQSNATGVKHDLKWINVAHEFGFHVLLDAAAFAPTSFLDLSQIKPDFVSVSFYKIFGYPTGVGCLLVRNPTFELLEKRWFAGGTVDLASVLVHKKFLKENHERFEDGTVNYLNIPAVKTGLEFIESIGKESISHRIKLLVFYMAQKLGGLLHDNGRPLVRIFGPTDFDNRGGNLMMNFFDAQGNMYPLEYIERVTSDNGISIRTGCFCNPGIDEINNQIPGAIMSQYFQSRTKANYHDMTSFIGRTRGAVRVSVGIPTVKRDIDNFISVISRIRDKVVSNRPSQYGEEINIL